ncbi:MAG TPA: ribonuclease HII [Nitrososphaera sp.]|nr:ribonuclease HII [Nitrososphaera sp.]
MLCHGDSILIGGVDEAGRGSIVGPLIIAGISIRESKVALLHKMGVKDSKALNPKVRARLFVEIMKVIDSVCIHKIDPVEVDDSVSFKGLNRLEARVMASVINAIGADEVYVDCCDVNPQRYREYMECHLTCKPKLYSLHHADVINMVVSAASIIAKITRDQEIQHICSRYGSIGSGYPSDERTMRFIREWVTKNGSAPDFTRKSWKPLRLMLDEITHCKI